MIGGEIALIVWKLVFSIFMISILSMAAYVAVSFVRIIRDAEPETEEPETEEPETEEPVIEERETISACLSCRMRKWCIDSVQAHDYAADCFEPEI